MMSGVIDFGKQFFWKRIHGVFSAGVLGQTIAKPARHFCGRLGALDVKRAIVASFVALTLSGVSELKAADYGSPVRVLPFSRPGSVGEMATLDMNGDGLDDVVVASFYYPLQNAGIPIQILLNNGNGGFIDGTSQVITGAIPTTVMPRRIVVADFNNDGRPDVFIADHGYDASPFPGAQSRLLLSSPDGHYTDASANLPQQLAFTHSATAADIDGSGRIALYLGNIYGQGQVPPQLLLNDGTGHFTVSAGRLPSAQTNLSINTYTSSAFADVNGDGCPDLILGGDQNTQSQVLVNDCRGFFSVLANALPAKLFSDGITLHVQPFKMNGSNLPGLLLVSTHGNPFYQGRAIQVLVNNGNGAFHDESTQRLSLQEDTGSWIRYAYLADIAGQCRSDIFPEFNGGGEVRLYLDDGQQHFTQKTSDLPNVFGAPLPVRMFSYGRVSFLSTGGDGFYLVPATSAVQCPSLKAPHDFNADGKSDIVWRNSAGDNAMWLMNGATISSVAGLVNVPTNWYVVGQRDFNGDGKTDLLWASTTGDVAIWLMNGSSIISVASLGNVGANWGVAGTADFNGDGKGDILWRSTAGDNAIWFMNGTTLSSIAVVGNVPTNWTVVGTADFNADGKGDILWRNSGGDNAIWLMNGATISSVAGLGNVPTNWSVVGTADFNGDGKGDIMWRNSGGDNAIWLMNGTTIASVAGLGNIPTNWSVVSNGDYNGDGNGDILWRNSGGDNAIWFMNGATLSSISGLGNVPTNWTIQNAAAN